MRTAPSKFRLPAFVVLVFLFSAYPAEAQQPCVHYISSTLHGHAPAASTSAVMAPFTIACNGSFSGNLKSLSRVRLRLQLERLTPGGTWETVDTGYITYSGAPGTYRYSIKNDDARGSDWVMDFRAPSHKK